MLRRTRPGRSLDGLPNASTTVRTMSRPGMCPSVIVTRAVPRARFTASSGSTPAAASATVPASRPVIDPGEPANATSVGTSRFSNVPRQL